MIPPKSGTIAIDGVGKPVLEVGRPAYGVMFQSGALFGSLSVGENIALPLEEWTDLPPEAIKAIVQAKLRLVGLSGFENHPPSAISGGMKKRAAIARAMALEPSLIFLDEPSAGLDPVTSVEAEHAHPDTQRPAGHHRGARNARLANYLQDSQTVHPARQDDEEHPRARGSEGAAGRKQIRAVHQFFNRTTEEA